MLITYQSGFHHVNYDNVCIFKFQIVSVHHIESGDQWNLEVDMTNGETEILVLKKPFDHVEKVFKSICLAKKSGRIRFDISEVK